VDKDELLKRIPLFDQFIVDHFNMLLFRETPQIFELRLRELLVEDVSVNFFLLLSELDRELCLDQRNSINDVDDNECYIPENKVKINVKDQDAPKNEEDR